jgi:hypothetical protein
MSDLLRTITIETVEKWESEKIEIHFTEKDIRSSKIIDIQPLGEKKDDHRTPFSVVLLTDLKEAYYEQGTFKVVLPNHNQEFMFMVPIGVEPESRGMRYELVFT